MKKILKISLCLLAAILMVNCLCCPLEYATVHAQSTGVIIDGVSVQFNANTGFPFVNNGRTLVPLRITMESFGAEVDWEAETATAIVRKDTTTVRCPVWQPLIYRNNVKIENDAQAVEISGRTYLPIRAVLEAFGAQVDWDGTNVIVTSGGSAALVHSIETTPSVTKNYWGIWNEALALKSAGDYRSAIQKIISVSAVFLKENTAASNAMLFKHMGECYSNLGEYANASACFKREAYYWGMAPGMIESQIDANRRSNLIKANAQIYIKTTDASLSARTHFGVTHEPQSGIIIGAYSEGDTALHNPYNPNMFYMDTYPQLVGKDMGAYLLYLPYGTSIHNYDSHIQKAKQKGKVMQIALEPHGGVEQVNDTDGYLIKLAKDMENSDCRMMLRFAGEMNDTTSTWYTKDTNLYISKFRTVADIFHKYAPSVPVIWAPNFYPPDTIDDYYPGDAYVDYVGISSYMMHQPITDPLGQGVDRSRWSNQLDKIYALYGHKKPIIIAEGGASYMDYDTGADITQFASAQLLDFYTYLPIKYPNIKFCFLFNSNRERQKFCLSTNNAYLAAYKQGITSDLYLSSIQQPTDFCSYYELGNNVPVRSEATELASYITTPSNDVAYVIYYVNGVYLATAYGAPYTVSVNLSGYSGQKVAIGVAAYNASNAKLAEQTVYVNVQ